MKIFREQKKNQQNFWLDKESFNEKYKNSCILITGIGSVGSEIVKQLLELSFKKLVLLDNSEITLFNLKEELTIRQRKKISFTLGCIRDSKKIDFLLKTHKPTIVIHTAAYKHVSLMEEDLYEAIRTNVEGTVNLFKSSLKNKVSQFVFISTDKAVYPKGNMGKTKLLSELYLETFFKNKVTQVKIVRFGNVINSSGSIMPIIKKCIKKNRSISVRGKDTTRYFIYVDVVAKSILNSLLIHSEGKYLLEMGEAIKIISLINELKKNNGSEIVFNRMLKGEKEKEELIFEFETKIKTPYKELKELKSEIEHHNSIRQDIINVVRSNKVNNKETIEKCLNSIIFNQ